MSLATILSEHPELTLLASNRIKCAVTNHEIPPNVGAVLSHINGKKYKKALEWYNKDFSKYLPYIVAHKSDPTKLYCNVTKQELNKIPDQVEKHIAGKRFQRLKEEYDLQKNKKTKKTLSTEKEAQSESEEDDEEPDFWIPEGFQDDEDDDDDKLEDDDQIEDRSSAFEEDEDQEESSVEERPVMKPKQNKSSNTKKNSVTKGGNKRKRDHEDDLVIIRKTGGKKGKRSKEAI